MGISIDFLDDGLEKEKELTCQCKVHLTGNLGCRTWLCLIHWQGVENSLCGQGSERVEECCDLFSGTKGGWGGEGGIRSGTEDLTFVFFDICLALPSPFRSVSSVAPPVSRSNAAIVLRVCGEVKRAKREAGGDSFSSISF